MKQSSLLKFVSHTRDLSAPHDVSQTCNSPAPISAMHAQPLTLPPAGVLPPTPLSHRASIEAAFDTSTWNWSQWTCPGWRQCFYDVMYERSLSASPLQPSEAQHYLASISSLPRLGFFPHPSVAVRNLARIRSFLSVHDPVPLPARCSSVLCVPAEHCAKSRLSISPNIFLGFHMGWITAENCPPPPGIRDVPSVSHGTQLPQATSGMGPYNLCPNPGPDLPPLSCQ
jgi:hypothetical protein